MHILELVTMVDFSKELRKLKGGKYEIKKEIMKTFKCKSCLILGIKFV